MTLRTLQLFFHNINKSRNNHRLLMHFTFSFALLLQLLIYKHIYRSIHFKCIYFIKNALCKLSKNNVFLADKFK